MRKYPVGIQSFETIRTDGYVYVGRPVTTVGLAFSSKERNIMEWRCAPATES